MCGAVRVQARPARPSLSACHCDMCRRWTSGAFVAFEAERDSVRVTGPARTIRTSDWAERAFCPECGAPLWYRITRDGPMQGQMQLAAGLFENAAGGALRLELYIDRKPGGYAFEGGGSRRQMTEAEVVALHAPPAGGAER